MKEKFDIELGTALRTIREKSNITQAEVAEKMKVTKMTISHWESGARTLTAKNLKRYCDILGVTVQYVFDMM